MRSVAGLTGRVWTLSGRARGELGGISREEFDAYYEDYEKGLAIMIVLSKPRAFKPGVGLGDIGLDRAPWEYRYVDRIRLERIFMFVEWGD